jgi:hypothetical protein
VEQAETQAESKYQASYIAPQCTTCGNHHPTSSSWFSSTHGPPTTVSSYGASKIYKPRQPALRSAGPHAFQAPGAAAHACACACVRLRGTPRGSHRQLDEEPQQVLHAVHGRGRRAVAQEGHGLHAIGEGVRATFTGYNPTRRPRRQWPKGRHRGRSIQYVKLCFLARPRRTAAKDGREVVPAKCAKGRPWLKGTRGAASAASAGARRLSCSASTRRLPHAARAAHIHKDTPEHVPVVARI